MKKFLRIIGILIVLIAAFFAIKTQTTRFGGAQTPTTTLANPASVYCEQQSGTLEIVTDTSGAQSGICHLVDGTTCDEWAYFRGECPITGAEVTGMAATGVVENLGGEIIYQEVSTDKYTVKVEQGKNIAGENIYLYDTSGKKVFSLLAKHGDLQGVYLITGDYLIVDVGSDLMREIRIYNIVTNQQIFTSAYATEPLLPEDQKGKGYGLHVEGNKVSFSTLVYDMYNNRQIPQPKTTPTCPTRRSTSSIGYSEVRVFNLDTKKLEKTGNLVCTFIQ